MSKRVDITGTKINEWEVLEYVGNQKYLCRCSCGREKIVTSYSLRKGASTNCGHTTGRVNKDLSGNTIGEWKVLYKIDSKTYMCECSCGVQKEVGSYSLKSGGSKSCGHSTTGKKDLIGKHFGEWEVLEDLGKGYWKCRCSCGKESNIETSRLTKGKTKSCGHGNVAFKDITGQKFGELEAKEFIGHDKWLCKCSCGKDVIASGYSLRAGTTHSCGHASSNKLIDLTGKYIGDWEVLYYVGDSKFLCRCSCGVEKEVSAYLLRNGQSKSCGHPTVDKNDLVGKQVGDFTVIENTAAYRYLCRCVCGRDFIIDRYTLLKDEKPVCNHKYTDFESYVGKKINAWTIDAYLEKDLMHCVCECGTERIIKLSAILSGHTKSCGCKKKENYRQKMLARYSDVAPQKVGKPRTAEQIEMIDNRDMLMIKLEEFNKTNNRYPKTSEVAEILSVTDAIANRTIHKLKLEEYVTFGIFSEKEEEVFKYVKKICDASKLSVVQRDRTVIGPLELDIYIPDKKLAIEFNGSYWHSDINKDITYHQDKMLACMQKGVRLIQIFEYEWDNADKQEKLKSMLKSMLVGSDRILYARNLQVKQIENTEAGEFELKYHLQGYRPAEVNLGLYDNDEIVSLMSFGKPLFNKNYHYEIIRYCIKDTVGIVGGAERLFSYFVTNFNPQSIITYSDLSKFTGTVYSRIGFKTTPENWMTEPNYYWVNMDDNTVLSRYQTQKKKLIEMGLGTDDETEETIMIRLGFIRIHDCGSLRLEWKREWLEDKREVGN